MKALIIVCLLTTASSACAGDTRYYDRHGDYVGRSSQDRANPSQQSVYSRDGKYIGRIMEDKDNPGNSRVYDQHETTLGGRLDHG